MEVMVIYVWQCMVVLLYDCICARWLWSIMNEHATVTINTKGCTLMIDCRGTQAKEEKEEKKEREKEKKRNKYFELKNSWGAPELELLAVVIVLFAPILHESLTNSNFVTNTICQLSHAISHHPIFLSCKLHPK